MNAKEFLGSARDMERMVAVKQAALEQLRATAERATSHISLAPGKGKPRDMGDIVARLAECEAALAAQVESWLAARRQIEALIALVPDSACRAVLELRYMLGLPWHEVAGKLYMEERTVYRVHERALRQAERVFLSKKYRGGNFLSAFDSE